MRDDIASVRKRPGMYVGDTRDGTGLHNMVYEVVGNAVQETLSGHATEILVTLNVDGSCTVRDNGRGIPVDNHPREHLPAAEIIMTRLAPVRRFEGDPPKVTGSPHFGLCVVNSLSEWLTLRIWCNGKEHRMGFREGELEERLQMVGDADGQRGTEVTFRPSPTIFTDTKFDATALEQGLRELAASNSAATLKFVDNRHGARQG